MHRENLVASTWQVSMTIEKKHPASNSVSISFLDKKDAVSYVRLFKEVFNKNIDEAYFQWKYIEENGVDHQSLVMGDSDSH